MIPAIRSIASAGTTPLALAIAFETNRQWGLEVDRFHAAALQPEIRTPLPRRQVSGIDTGDGPSQSDALPQQIPERLEHLLVNSLVRCVVRQRGAHRIAR
jgi:hypothetical protein